MNYTPARRQPAIEGMQYTLSIEGPMVRWLETNNRYLVKTGCYLSHSKCNTVNAEPRSSERERKVTMPASLITSSSSHICMHGTFPCIIMQPSGQVWVATMVWHLHACRPLAVVVTFVNFLFYCALQIFVNVKCMHQWCLVTVHCTTWSQSLHSLSKLQASCLIWYEVKVFKYAAADTVVCVMVWTHKKSKEKKSLCDSAISIIRAAS